MKRYILILIIMVVSTAWGVVSPKWTNSELWQHSLRVKMSENDVTRLLGKPIDQEETRLIKVWYYQECPTRINGKVTERPNCAKVNFKLDKTNRAKLSFKVATWVEPNWEQLEAEKLKQVEEEKAQLLAKQQAAEELLKEQELLRAERQAKLQAKQEKRRQEIEQQRIERVAQLEEKNDYIETQTAQVVPKKKWTDYCGKGMVIAGVILFAIVVFYLAFIRKNYQ